MVKSLVADRTLIQLNWTTGPMVMLSYSVGHGFGGDREHTNFNRGGDLQFFVGYRHTDYLLGPTFRRGTAFRLGGGGPPWGASNMNAIDDRERLAVLSPFRASAFGVDQPLTLTVEQRIEMVGCHGPFLDLRIDVSRWKPPNGSAVWDVPIELAGGGYVWETVALYGAIGVELRSADLIFRHLTRTSFGIDWQPALDHKLRLGLRGGAITGGNVTGVELAATFTWLFGKGRGFE